MIRPLMRALPALLVFALAAAPVAPAFARESAKDKEAAAKAKPGKAAKPADDDDADEPKAAAKGKQAAGKKDAGKKDAKADAGKKDNKGAGGKSTPVGTFGEWGAFTAQGKGKTCYALARPKDRAPASPKRDDAYIFISNRTAENVRNEVSIIMGFTMKDGSDQKADIGGTVFELVAKGGNAWLKNPAEESQFIDALRKGSKLVVKASSIKGNSSTDTYSLSGFSDALARINKDCQ